MNEKINKKPIKDRPDISPMPQRPGYGYQPIPGSSNTGTPPCVRPEMIVSMSADGSMGQAHLQARLDIIFKMLLYRMCDADARYWNQEWEKLTDRG